MCLFMSQGTLLYDIILTSLINMYQLNHWGNYWILNFSKMISDWIAGRWWTSFWLYTENIQICTVCTLFAQKMYKFVLFVLTQFSGLYAKIYKFGSSSVWWHHGFLQIITVAFLLFLVPAWGSNLRGQLSNPVGQSLTLT